MDARFFFRLAGVIIACGIAAFVIMALITKVWVAGGPSLHRHYPASPVLRTSPPPDTARSLPHGRSVDDPSPRYRASRVARASLVYMPSPLPRHSDWVPTSLSSPAVSAFPAMADGSACATSFSRPAQRSLTLRPAHSRCHQVVTRFTGGFNHFVTSTVAPVASGWSDCRVGLSPTGKAPPWHGARQKQSHSNKASVRRFDLHAMRSRFGSTF